MRQLGILLFCVFILSCDSDPTNRNPFLQEIGFRIDLNLNLPLYSPLTTIGNAVFVDSEGAGIRGIFVINAGINTFRAFEASCPNVAPSSCSTLTFEGQTAICPCNENEFSLFTGQLLNTPEDDTRFFNLLEYQARLSGNTLIISN